MISIQVKGVEYNNFIDAEVSKSIDALCGSFSLTAATNAFVKFPFSVGDSCVIKVDDETFITGYIDSMKGSYSGTDHSMVIQGRSKSSDIVDSTIGHEIEFNGSISLKKVIELILKKSNINGISVIDSIGNLDKFSSSEKVSSEVGKTVFKTIEEYCRKGQVLITDNGDGDIVITRGEGTAASFSLINTLKSGNAHNIISASYKKDFSNRFNRYIVKSGLNVSGLNIAGLTDSASISSQEGSAAVDGEIRSSRTFYKLAEKASDASQCQTRSTWQANIARSRSITYSATVQGHSNATTKKPWVINSLVDVDDELVGINAKMLLSSLTFRTNLTEGSTTDLVLVPKDAYSLIASEQPKQKNTNSLAGLF